MTAYRNFVQNTHYEVAVLTILTIVIILPAITATATNIVAYRLILLQ